MMKIRENAEIDNALLVRNMIDESRRTGTKSRYNSECIKEMKKKSRCHGYGEIGHWWQDDVCTRKEVKRYGQRGP